MAKRYAACGPAYLPSEAFVIDRRRCNAGEDDGDDDEA